MTIQTAVRNTLIRAAMLVDPPAEITLVPAGQPTPDDELLASIWLYIDWYYVTRQLTTEQKDRFADAVVKAHRAANLCDSEEEFKEFDAALRWWRRSEVFRDLQEEYRDLLSNGGEDDLRAKRKGVDLVRGLERALNDTDVALTDDERELLIAMKVDVGVVVFDINPPPGDLGLVGNESWAIYERRKDAIR